MKLDIHEQNYIAAGVGLMECNAPATQLSVYVKVKRVERSLTQTSMGSVRRDGGRGVNDLA